MKSSVIAIDGPAYVGKSSISKCLARLMGHTYVNTGHMYRAVSKVALERRVNPASVEPLVRIAQDMVIGFETGENGFRTIVDGADWSQTLDAYEIVLMASKIARLSEVRKVLTEKQRAYTRERFIVMEGRDVGSVVFPEAAWKFFVTASLEVRAIRMHKMMDEASRRLVTDFRSLIPKVKALDDADMNREAAPLKQADDAVVYDNSDSPSEMQDALILQYYIRHSDEMIRNVNLLKRKCMEVACGNHP